MSNETKRYRVKIKNAKDNLSYVPFPDLVVKYTNGWAEPLKIKEGEEIPLAACDPEDVRKSFLAGSLHRYLGTDWIEQIIEVPKPKPLTPIEIAAIKAATPIQGTGDIPVMPPPPTAVSQKVEEVAPQNLPKESAPTTLSNFSLVKTYDDFCKLSYFLKLRFIKESNDIPLLKEIQQKSDSHQFKNNISVKLGK